MNEYAQADIMHACMLLIEVMIIIIMFIQLCSST